MPPKQKKITDSFKTLTSQSSSQDDLQASSIKSPNKVNLSPSSNPYGLSFPIEPIDDHNKLDVFIQSAIQGGVKRNWNLHQLKQTVKELQEEFKPKIEERVQFWEKELAKVDEILGGTFHAVNSAHVVETSATPSMTAKTIPKVLGGDLTPNTKSQKSLLDYFSSTNNEGTSTSIDITSVPSALDATSTSPKLLSDIPTNQFESKASITASPNAPMTTTKSLSPSKSTKALPSATQPTSAAVKSEEAIKPPTPLLGEETTQPALGTTSIDISKSIHPPSQPSASKAVVPSASSTQEPKVAQKAPKSQSKKSTRKSSKKASKKKKKVLDDEDDAMIEDEDDEYKPSLTDEEDQLILDEEEDIEADEDEELMLLTKDQQFGKRKRGTSSATVPRGVFHEERSHENATVAIEKKDSATTSAATAEEASEEDVSTSIKTRSARKKSRGTPKLGGVTSPGAGDELSKVLQTEGPLTIKIEDMAERDDSVSRGSNQSPLPFDDASSISMVSDIVQSLPQTPSTKKKKRTAASSTRRRKKKPSGSDDTGQTFVSSTQGGGEYDGDAFLGMEDEHYVASKTPSSQIDRTLPQYQFWEYINSFFPVIKKDRLKLLEGENSENDEAFKIGKKGKYYTEKWEEENTKIYTNLPKKTTSSDQAIQQLTDYDTESLSVEKASKLFFSQHSLSQRLLSSLIEERDLVPLETFFDDISASSAYTIDSDNESIDEQTPRKSSRTSRKSITTPSSARSAAFPSSATTPITPSTANMFNSNSGLPSDLTSSSILEHQQHLEITEYLKQKITNLSKNQIQSANHILAMSNQFKDVDQMLNSTSFDYSPQYMSVFEEKLLHEIKSIGVLPQQQLSNPQLWVDDESREDDDICAEIRTLQNKLREQIQRTNDIRMKILKRVKSQLHEEKDIEKKIAQFAELERKLFPPTPQNKARR
ncbi:hypothetical protein C9374_011318 [Naegleria lovaniensis]|uniref:Uncharacterized protein n=1 Tax=Naegleria lovaniensis TaxID=51637 RepID=A0AA88H0N0_NAELO|nr:uncharacterized protein C9374_011318 [Naegleria lovaniensis]KAG2392593.1 hypothetical protein C9374_011318 [Naegleria lovaniensis]